MAKISNLDVVQALTGGEHLPIVQDNATRRVTMAAFRDLITPFLQYWYKGDQGDRGPNGYSVVTLEQLRAAPFSDGPLMYDGRVWTGQAGNFAEVGADNLDIVKQDDTDLSIGAWTASYALPSITARTDGSGDSTSSVTASIARAVARGSRGIYKPPGLSYIAGRLADINKRGLRFYGDGILIEELQRGNLDGRRVVASYADDIDYVVGREYMVTAANVLAAGATLRGSFFGDSTTGDYAVSLPAYVPHRLLELAALSAGFTSVDFVNHFYNGSVASMMDLSLIRAEDHILFINYGVNDMGEAGDAITLYYNRLDALLTEIRARYPYPNASQVNGVTKDIVLLGPNSVNSWSDGRGQFRYEQLRPLLIGLARKHQCCFVDKYAFMQDSTNAKPWMDEGALYHPETGDLIQSNIHIHPTVLGNDKLWSLVARAVFSEFVGPNRANAFHNLDQNRSVRVDDTPYSFARGITLARTTGVGWPDGTGYVRTEHHADGIVSQTAYSFAPFSPEPPRTTIRMSRGAEVWGPWSNSWTNLGLAGGAIVQPGNVARIRANAYGEITAQGAVLVGAGLASGATFANTGAIRPLVSDVFRLETDASPLRVVWDSASGDLRLYPGDSAFAGSVIYLSGLRGVVAGM